MRTVKDPAPHTYGSRTWPRHAGSDFFLDVEVTPDLRNLRPDGQEWQPSFCEWAQNADKQKSLLKSLPNQLPSTGLAAKGSATRAGRSVPGKITAPKVLRQFARMLPRLLPCWAVWLTENQAPQPATKLSARQPPATSACPLEQPSTAAPGTDSTQVLQAAKTTSCSLRNKHILDNLSFQLFSFSPRWHHHS